MQPFRVRVEDRAALICKRGRCCGACTCNPARALPSAKAGKPRRSAHNGWSGRIRIGRVVVARQRRDDRQRCHSQDDRNRERPWGRQDGERPGACRGACRGRHVVIASAALIARMRWRRRGTGPQHGLDVQCIGKGVPHAHSAHGKGEHCNAEAQNHRAHALGEARSKQPAHGRTIDAGTGPRNGRTSL